jgi:uncharacterized protein (DUF342 family)
MLGMVEFVVSNQLDDEGKIIDKLITITTYTPKQTTSSLTELNNKKIKLETQKTAIDAELADINKILTEVKL